MANIELRDELVEALQADATSRGLRDGPDALIASLVDGFLRQRAVGGYALDGLTGCPTRHRFEQELNKATWGTSWTDHSLYQERFLCIDLDNFKAYIDVHGFGPSDAVLQGVAAELRRHYGEDVYRFGGDEFVVMLHRREPWVPDVPPDVTLKHAVVHVSVHRNQHRNHHVNRWILHHLDGGILAALPRGVTLECTSPSWLQPRER